MSPGYFPVDERRYTKKDAPWQWPWVTIPYMADGERDTELLRAERDLYQRLIELGGHDRLETLLDEALALVTDLAGAQKGYLAAQTAAGELAKLRGIAEEEAGAIRDELSRGIIAEALRSGKTVNTASARNDPRFQARESVQAQRLEAVLCAPIGRAAVLYLAGRDRSGPFGGREQRLVETFARGIAPFVERLVREDESSDRTTLVRSKLRADDIVGRSAALAKALEVAVVAASSDLPVLLLGESGVGKSAFARMIHESSGTKRAKGPFVELNCAALPETLAESELFGAEKGAHSTAHRKTPGKIAAAEGGTLLLDEVGELPPSIQAKLLGFLQSKRYFALGATAESTADVRILAATNADIGALVREKKFREDLYYRLHVLTARLPALRERREDVVILADGFAAREGAPPLSSVARAALAASDWPGNVRELLATVQRGAAFARAEGAPHIEPRHLFPERVVEAAKANETPTFSEATRRFQQQFLREALDRAQGNVSEAARQLDLSRSRLYELLRDHDLLRGRGAK